MKKLVCVLLFSFAAVCLASCGAPQDGGQAGGGTGVGGGLNSQTTIFDSVDVENGDDGIVVTAEVYVNENDANMLYLELGEDAAAKAVYTLTQKDGRIGLEYCSPSGGVTELADLDGDLQGEQDIRMEKGLNVFRIREEGEARYEIRFVVEGLDPETILYYGIEEPD